MFISCVISAVHPLKIQNMDPFLPPSLPSFLPFLKLLDFSIHLERLYADAHSQEECTRVEHISVQEGSREVSRCSRTRSHLEVRCGRGNDS